MLNYAIDERALADLIDLVDAVIEECTDDDYARAMRRQRDWLVRRRDEVATLAAAQERANRDAGDLPMPQLFTESLPDDELAAANRPPEETRERPPMRRRFTYPPLVAPTVGRVERFTAIQVRGRGLMVRNNTNQPPSAAEGSFVRLHAALIAMIAQVVGGVALAVVVALDLAIGWKVGAVVGYIAFGVAKGVALRNGRETRLYAEE